VARCYLRETLIPFASLLLIRQTGDTVDLDLAATSKHGLRGRTNWLVVREKLLVYGIHSVEVIQICKVNANFHNARKITAGSLQNKRHIVELKAGFPSNISELELLRYGIYGRLACNKDKPSRDYRVGVGTKNPGKFVRGNDPAICGRATSRHNLRPGQGWLRVPVH
jgi:hypothetical protein